MDQSLPLDSGTEHTWGVAEIHRALGELIQYRFGGPVWITGELRSLSKSPAGHAYFDLIEPGSEGQQGAARLAVTLFSTQRQRVNAKLVRAGNRVRIAEGTELRVRGELRTYAPRSRVQFNMTDVDPAYTLGVISQQRDLALAALEAAGLLGRNAALPLVEPPVRIALVTSRGSAAAADVLDEIQSSQVGFEVTCIDVRTQGREAESMMVAALRTAETLGVDAVLLVRGGGDSADLAVFDSEVLGRAIAHLSVPVFTGIGHEVDHSVADVVAHSAHKTPTAAAAAIVRRAEEAEHRLSALSASVATAARGAAARATNVVESRSHAAGVAARRHLEHEARLLDMRLDRVAGSVPRALAAASRRVETAAGGVARAARDRLEHRGRELDRLAALVEARDPVHTMQLGWSVTHSADGSLLRDLGDARVGDTIRTKLRDGVIVSTVSALELNEPTGDARDDGATDE